MTSKVPPGDANPAIALLERLYAPLTKQLNLTPEQSRNFFEVILDGKMKAQAQMADLLRHEDFSRMTRAIADLQKETDATLQALLGPANFGHYQEYQKGIADRGALDLMKNDFAQNPLSDEQRQLLLKAMESGRKTVGTSAGDVVAFSIADTDETMAEKLNRQQMMDQHILEQAAGFLSPVQLQILGSAQARMMNARKNGYAKAREMFATRGPV